MEVKVSAASARLRFHGCDPEYITKTCHGRCCEGSSGLVVSIHASEREEIVARGGSLPHYTEGSALLTPANPAVRGAKQLCPFKADHLCALHGDGKPFGCVASPFTLNHANTLIVRNRYKLLRCYDDGPRLPAYRAFRASLDRIFGKDEARRISTHLDEGGGDIIALMSLMNWHMLRDNDGAKNAR